MSLIAQRPNDLSATAAQKDLDFLGSPVLTALMDISWTLLLIAVIFVFHPLAG